MFFQVTVTPNPILRTLRQRVSFKANKKEMNELTLWYPSRDEKVESICHTGIDFEMTVSVGPIGQGKYFFRHAYEAHEKRVVKRYQKDTIAYMFLCEVLVGDEVKVYLS